MNRRWAGRIAFQSVGSAIVRAVVEKRVEVRRVEVNAEAAANDEIALLADFVSEADAG